MKTEKVYSLKAQIDLLENQVFSFEDLAINPDTKYTIVNKIWNEIEKLRELYIEQLAEDNVFWDIVNPVKMQAFTDDFGNSYYRDGKTYRLLCEFGKRG